jgi:hypothetical protein
MRAAAIINLRALLIKARFFGLYIIEVAFARTCTSTHRCQG